MSRIANKFADLKSKEQSAFVSYIMAGDPNYDTTLEIMKGLPDAGVDIIESLIRIGGVRNIFGF